MTTPDLLRWIENAIEALNDREFANSLRGVQEQLAHFNTYRNVEKPPKFMEKGNLEVLLFTLQVNLKSFLLSLSTLNPGWRKLKNCIA